MDEKSCSRCSETKTLDKFSKNSFLKSGLSSHCKQCQTMVDKDLYENNKEKYREKNRQYYQDHGAAERARFSAYHRKNPEKISQRVARRRAKDKSVEFESGLTAPVLLTELGSLCHICGSEMLLEWPGHYDPLYRTIDHLQPISKGGSHTRENLRLAHWVCNIRKRDREI